MPHWFGFSCYLVFYFGGCLRACLGVELRLILGVVWGQGGGGGGGGWDGMGVTLGV